MDKIKIRKFSITDYDALISLYQRAALEFKPEGRDSRDQMEKQIKNNTCLIYLACIDENIIGSVMVTHDSRKGWINRLAVDPNYRRKKIATQLVDKAEEWLNKQDIEIVACLIEGWNTESMKFFQKLHYRRFPDVAYYTKRKHPGV